MKKLAENPKIHRIRFKDVRRASVPHFQFYGVFYFVMDLEVRVIAAFHGRRHPRWLRERRRETE